jgi:hypothetical protein
MSEKLNDELFYSIFYNINMDPVFRKFPVFFHVFNYLKGWYDFTVR